HGALLIPQVGGDTARGGAARCRLPSSDLRRRVPISSGAARSQASTTARQHNRRPRERFDNRRRRVASRPRIVGRGEAQPMSALTMPRGPKGRFPFGSFGDFSRDQLGFYAACARDYGDVVSVRLGPRRALLIYHPDAIEEVLVTRNRDFVKSPAIALLRPLLGDGLLNSEGAAWLRQRRLVQPAFHRQRLATYGATMATYAERALAAWKDDQVLDVRTEMMTLTQAIVAKTLFDADVSDQAHGALQA